MNNKAKQEMCYGCGMLLNEPTEFHTYAHCELMKQLHNSASVRANIEFTVENHPNVKRRDAEIAALKAKLDAVETWIASIPPMLSGHVEPDAHCGQCVVVHYAEKALAIIDATPSNSMELDHSEHMRSMVEEASDAD